WGATLYFWGRVAFVLIYMAGIVHLRTAAFLVSVVGILLVLLGVATFAVTARVLGCGLANKSKCQDCADRNGQDISMCNGAIHGDPRQVTGRRFLPRVHYTAAPLNII
ncbi:MAG: hypothetical protein JWL98_2195, partial [Xanthomonadaceae bacterium]|nr:hypothetical protein [Xanthomonadaceae bacterium]